MPRPIQARIDLAALRHNYLVARQHAARGQKPAKAWAVLKADAYGHGLLRVAQVLEEVEPDGDLACECRRFLSDLDR